MLPRRFYLDSILDSFITEREEFDIKCDIYEKDEQLYIVCDMPGVKKEDIEVECSDGYLMITALKKEETLEEENQKLIRRERFYGKTSRKFYVGNKNEEDIRAEFKDGVLTVIVPKENAHKNKKLIDIM